MVGAWALSGGTRRLPNEGSGAPESETWRAAANRGVPFSETGRLPLERLLARSERASREAPITNFVDVAGAVGEIRRRQGRRDVAAAKGAQRVGPEEVESLIDAGAHGECEGAGAHLLGTSVELRIGERRDQEFLEVGVEIGLVPGLRARTDEFMALRGGGGDLVCDLRGDGLARVDRHDGDLLVRDGEGIHALVERLDQLDVVAPLPARELLGFIGPRRKEPCVSLVRLIL